MDQDPLSVVRVAKTPTQARLFVGMLQAQGIRALVEGGSLADEVAVSRTLMNVHGTQVKVRSEDLERAREVLTDVAIDEGDLEAQALAVDASEVEAPPPTSRPISRSVWALIGAAVGVLVTWMARDVLAEVHARAQDSPFHQLETHPWGLREFWRADPEFYRDLFDEDGDGNFERIEEHTPSGVILTYDRDADGRYEEYERRENTGVVENWRDTDRSGQFDTATVKGRDGKLLQQLKWIPARGYEVTPR